MQYWDKKSNATIFDVEIDGVRTMICRRAGKFKKPGGANARAVAGRGPICYNMDSPNERTERN